MVPFEVIPTLRDPCIVSSAVFLVCSCLIVAFCLDVPRWCFSDAVMGPQSSDIVD